MSATRPILRPIFTAVADLATALAGADAVVFAAGAGPGSGAARKLTVDRNGAIKLLEAARTGAVERYVMVSSVGRTLYVNAGEDPIETAIAGRLA